MPTVHVRLQEIAIDEFMCADRALESNGCRRAQAETRSYRMIVRLLSHEHLLLSLDEFLSFLRFFFHFVVIIFQLVELPLKFSLFLRGPCSNSETDTAMKPHSHLEATALDGLVVDQLSRDLFLAELRTKQRCSIETSSKEDVRTRRYSMVNCAIL